MKGVAPLIFYLLGIAYPDRAKIFIAKRLSYPVSRKWTTAYLEDEDFTLISYTEVSKPNLLRSWSGMQSIRDSRHDLSFTCQAILVTYFRRYLFLTAKPRTFYGYVCSIIGAVKSTVH